jgi:serine/threonine protein kinase
MLRIDRKKILGRGGYGVVYEGNWGETKVAIKRIPRDNAAGGKQEEDALKRLNHENIIKLFHVEEDPDFRYFQIHLTLKVIRILTILIDVSFLNCAMLHWINYFLKKMIRKNTVAHCLQKKKFFSN